MDNINFENLATKDDLKVVLSNYPTKDDLKQEINGLDEKLSTSFKSEINRLEDKVFNLNEKVSTLDEKIDALDGRFDEVINHIDGAMKVFKNTEEETAAHTVSYREHAEVLDNHEKRIKILEVRPAGA
ncbi:MAG: hypothetical protein PHT40_03485 [Patescibacteria group bacterium]|nr:hypothetical protein [Patescibacteria group bacterium]